MSVEDDATTGIIVPGPELRAKIERSAASLAKRDKRKAEEMMAKVLASPKREEFLYFEMTHVFYPFFLQKLNEYRAHPELIPTDDKESSGKTTAAGGGGGGGGGGTGVAATSTNSTTTIKAGGVVRREGGTATRHDPKRDEALRQAEIEAQRYLEDPFPSQYSLNLLHGTVDMPALTLSYMTCTAQYVAKYGERFLKDLIGRHRNNAGFRFLNSEDVRHEILMKLVDSYRLILHHDPDEVEDRLERYHSTRNLIDTVCEEKVKYARAAIARRKAALLSDEALRDKLEWNVFTVVQQFTLGDLGLDGPMPETAVARRRAYLSSSNGTTTAAAANAAADSSSDLSSAVTKVAAAAAASSSGGDAVGEAVKDVQRSAPRMLQPPEGGIVAAAPTFTPTFISSHLVSSTDPTAPLSRTSERYHNVDESYRAQGIAPVRRTVDYFVDPQNGQHIRARELTRQGTEAGDGGNDIVSSNVKRVRTEDDDKGLATDAEFEQNLRRWRAEENKGSKT